jgi:hypothetical protein
MANVINLSLNFQAGFSYKLKIPTTLSNDGGFTPKQGTVSLYTGQSRELKKGFCLESEVVGSLGDEGEFEDEVAIRYKHKLAATNVVWFYAYTGERVRILSQPIMVHTHESIAQGGPAYGTYFSYVDDTTKDGDNV